MDISSLSSIPFNLGKRLCRNIKPTNLSRVAATGATVDHRKEVTDNRNKVATVATDNRSNKVVMVATDNSTEAVVGMAAAAAVAVGMDNKVVATVNKRQKKRHSQRYKRK